MMANHLKAVKKQNTQHEQIPFEAGKWVPLELNPTVGRKLSKETLDLAPV